jgi:hypothetical protein
LTVFKKTSSLAGDYQCNAIKVDEENKKASVKFTLINEDCKSNEKTCSNGQCIEESLVCNNKTDCEDGSDEASCYSSGNCKIYLKFSPKNKKLSIFNSM